MPIPAGFTQHSSGWWFKLSDQSGPYVFDGTTLTLATANTTGTTSNQVQGNVASGASDAGTNPVKIGGVYTFSPTAFTVGQRVDAWFGTVGSLGTFITGLNGTQVTVQAQSIDAISASSTNGLSTGSFNNIYNGTTWDRVRGNIDTAALINYTAAAAGTNGTDQINYNARGVKLVIDITALTGVSPTLTVTVQGKDAASGKYYTILASAALAAVATTTLEIYPGIATAANATQGVTLPRVWRVITTITGTTPAVTATVGASVIV